MPLVALGALAIGGSITGGILANKGANAQAQAVQNASAQSVAEQQREYDQSRQDLAPWRNSGAAANGQLAYLLGVGPQSSPSSQQGTLNYGGGMVIPPSNMTANYGRNGMSRYAASADSGYQSPDTAATTLYAADPSGQTGSPSGVNTSLGGYGSLMQDFTGADLQNEPGYQFGLSEGSKALQRSAAARGQLFSGGTLKSLTQYNNDYASTKFNDAFNRFNTNKLNRYNMLAGLSQGGQQATNTTVAAGSNAANNISNTYMNAGSQIGNARASGYAATGQAINGGISNLLDLYTMSHK